MVECMVVVAIVALLTLLLLPAVLHPKREGRRAQCMNNMKQIVLALHSYEQEYGVLPPERTVDAQGRPLHSWRTLILPYLEQAELYRTIDLSKPWHDPVNASALASMPSTYRCPMSPWEGNTTSYFAVVGDGFALHPDQPRRLSEVADGPENTLVLVEAGDAGAVPWMAPADADEVILSRLGPDSKLRHDRGIHGAFVNGRVLPLKPTLPAAKRRAFATIAGGEQIGYQDL